MSSCSECHESMPNDGQVSFYRCQPCADKRTEANRQSIRKRLDEETPDHYRWAHRDAPELRQRVKPSSAIALAFGAMTAPSVVFIGPAGSGKTSLARALWIERALALVAPSSREWPRNGRPDRERKWGMFTTCFEIAKARREHKLGAGEADLIEAALDARVLLLDELGAEADAFGTAVKELIHERHAHDLLTIYTTPFPMAELEATKYGAGITRRIFEGATVIRLGGK